MISNFVGYDHLSQSIKALVTHLSYIEVPAIIYEALKDAKWRDAVLEEMSALKKNGTWEILESLSEKHIVGCKWIFTVKYKADGSIDKFKARLIAKGFTQSYGIDYQEMFALVAKLNIIWVLLSLAVNLDWPPLPT